MFPSKSNILWFQLFRSPIQIGISVHYHVLVKEGFSNLKTTFVILQEKLLHTTTLFTLLSSLVPSFGNSSAIFCCAHKLLWSRVFGNFMHVTMPEV